MSVDPPSTSPIENSSSNSDIFNIIHTEVPASAIPEEWSKKSIAPQIILIPPSDTRDWKACISRCLSKYPIDIIRKDVDAVYVVYAIKLAGIRAGGYAGKRTVFICVADLKLQPIADDRIEETIHHELSSIFLDAHRKCLDIRQWENINPEHFRYSNWQGVKSKTAFESSVDLKSSGFVMEYSSTYLENDFNVMAEKLMSGSLSLWNDFEIYPRLKWKGDLTINFFECIDSSMNKQFFRSLLHEATMPAILSSPQDHRSPPSETVSER